MNTLELRSDIRDLQRDFLHLLPKRILLSTELVLLFPECVLIFLELLLGSKERFYLAQECRISDYIRFFVTLKPYEVTVNLFAKAARMLQVLLVAGHADVSGVRVHDHITRPKPVAVSAVDLGGVVLMRWFRVLLKCAATGGYDRGSREQMPLRRYILLNICSRPVFGYGPGR